MATIAQKVAGLVLVLQGYKEFRDGLDQSGEAVRKFNEAVASSQATTAITPPKTATALTEFGQQWKDLAQLLQVPMPELNIDQWNRLGASLEQFNATADVTEKIMVEQALAIKAADDAAKQLAESQARAAAQMEAYNKALDSAANSMISLGKATATALIGVTMVASRIEELGNILNITADNAVHLATEQAAAARSAGDLKGEEESLARAAAITSTSVQDEVKQVRALHLTGIVASEAVAQMIRYDLDWTRANELAREAQDAATYAMQDSSVAMNGLIQGIITLQPRLLRTYGIMINLDIAYEKWATANNVAVKEMTVTQRQQAALNEVLAKAPSIAGAYEVAMGTAAKQARSLKTDSINLAESIGESLTPILDTGVVAIRSMINGYVGLSGEARSNISQITALATGVSITTGVLIKGVSALSKFSASIRAAGGATVIFNSAMTLLTATAGGALGIFGLVATAIGAIIIALNNAEQAHLKEATAALETSETYDDYIGTIDDASNSVYLLSEALWGLVKAQEAASAAEMAKQLTASKKDLSDFAAMYKNAGLSAEQFYQNIRTSSKGISEFDALVLGDKDSVLSLARAMGMNADEAQVFADALVRLARAESGAAAGVKAYNVFERERYGILLQTMGVQENHSSLLYENTGRLKQYEKAIKDAAIAQEKLNRVISMQEEIDKNVENSAWALFDAQHQNTLALGDLDYEYAQKKEDIWEEMNKELAEIDAQLADIHANILDELLELDEEYARKREDAYEDMQQALADAERDLARDQEDAWEDMNQNLIDADEDLAYAIEDKRRDLLFDLEDAAREHADNLEDINREAQEDILDIEEEYAQKRADLESEFAENQADIQEKYKEARIRELVRMGYDEQWVRENWNDEMMQGPLEEAMEEELATLNENYDEELSDLELALQREREEREEALQQQIQEEEERYAEWREERMRNYNRDLEDLERKHLREEEEIRRSYERKIEDLQEQHRREEEEIASAYQRKLDDLAIQYERERQEIIEKLEQQRQDILKKYAEQADDLEKWYADRKTEIAHEYEKQRAEIAYQLDLNNLKASEKFRMLPGMFQPTYDALISQATTSMGLWSQAIINGIQSVFDALGAHSPSTVLQDLGESITGGLTLGLQKGALGGYSAGANVLPAMAGMTTNRNNNVSLSMPTTINSGMDAAVFQQMVLQTVQRAIRYG